MDSNVARRRLEAEWERLLQTRDAVEQDHLSAQTQDESTGELSPIDQHQADAGSDVFEREKDFAIRDQVDSDLQAIQDAFGRLDAGSYGTCATCGEAIAENRLAAVPTARFCVEHERLWELHAMSVAFPAEPYPRMSLSAEHLSEQEAIQHFEFLPDDDETEEEEQLSAEEAAVHTEPMT